MFPFHATQEPLQAFRSQLHCAMGAKTEPTGRPARSLVTPTTFTFYPLSISYSPWLVTFDFCLKHATRGTVYQLDTHPLDLKFGAEIRNATDEMSLEKQEYTLSQR